MVKVRQKRKTSPPESAPKRRRGRPFSPEGTTLDAMIMLRLSSELKEAMSSHVKGLKSEDPAITVASWLRQLAERELGI